MKKSNQPTIAETNKRENKNDFDGWATGKGHSTPAHSGKDVEYA